jgi:uncharacterized protein
MTTVGLMIQTRISSEGSAAYARWQQRVGQSLANWPGFLGQEVIAPNPPIQEDWFIIQQFRSAEDAQSWMQSPQLKAMLDEVRQYFVGKESISLISSPEPSAVSAIISCYVSPQNESAFVEWQSKVFEAESKFKGFRAHKLERPVPGFQENWTVVLTFDSDEDLNKWIESPQRKSLIEEGARYQENVSIRKTSYGFGFWLPREVGTPKQPPIFESNLLVLLVLYPTVFLWGYFISARFIDPHIPFWLALFIGNLFSTQLLGWFVAPWTFKTFGWWLQPVPPAKKALGYIILAGLYAISMALYAWLLATK